jgi:cytochrome c553
MKPALILASSFVTVAWLALPVASGQQLYSGYGDYQDYCSSCHGTTAKGDGVIAKSLARRPADLTKLSARNNGVFPDERVSKTIDGRVPGSGHSAPDMPAWAEVFAKSQESLGPEAASARIATLVEYLKTIQERR